MAKGDALVAKDIDLFDKNSLLRFIEWADIGMIDTNWLVSAPLTEITKRRQDLPEEAFVRPRDLVDKPIVALTYGWSNPGSPDTNGQYAKALKTYFGLPGSRAAWPSGKTRYPSGAALFWDHKSLHQHKMLEGWDGNRDTWSENVLDKRNQKQEVYFKRAMGGMQALYFHEDTEGVLIQEVPRDGKNPTGYHERGWTLMESVALNMTGRMAVLFLDGGCDSNGGGVLPPMLPQTFERELALRHFTCSGDTAAVLALYERGFRAHAQGSRKMYINVGIANGQRCEYLAEALHHFVGLQELSVEGYPISPARKEHPALNAAIDALVARGCTVMAGYSPACMEPW